jgi:hypothetical protein
MWGEAGLMTKPAASLPFEGKQEDAGGMGVTVDGERKASKGVAASGVPSELTEPAPVRLQG